VESVGVRQLRDGLSRYLAEVRAGHTVTITDHGRPIARLTSEGGVQRARQRERSAPRPVEASGTVSDLVAEQRR
jgi:prevent-host-death family protein